MLKKLILLASAILFISLSIFSLWVFKIVLQTRHNKTSQEKNTVKPEVTVTSIEGWTLDDLAQYLDNRRLVNQEEFLKQQAKFDVSGYPLLASKPKNASLEGFLFPDTYRLYKPATDFSPDFAKQLIAKMLDNFEIKFDISLQELAKKQNLTIFQTITLASILEKETGRNAQTLEQKKTLDEERRIIAGIFFNRLKIGMALQSDATINYITKKNNPQPLTEDLKIDSPYNTYKYKGLPPGPICNPSLSSIKAILDPAPSNYFYFLHKQPSGEPVYSTTFEEHVKNKLKYLK